MSKKKLLNQLENLLADLEQEATFLPSSSEQSLPGWTWEGDAQGLYVECSPEVEDVLGIPAEEFIGKPVADFALDTSSKIVIREALASGQFPDEAHVRFICPDGKIIPASFHIFASQLDEDSSSPTGARGFVQMLQPVVLPSTPPTPIQPKEPHPSIRPAASEFPTVVEDRPIALKGPTQPPAPSPHPGLPIREQPVDKTAHTPDEDHRGASVLEIPVKLEEQKLGFLQIADDTPGRKWSEDELHLVEQVADQLSLALENAQLFQNEQRRVNELNTLAEFSRMISQNLNLEEVFATAHTLIGRLMPTESFFINLLDSQKVEFSAAYIIDKNIRQPVSHFPANTGFSGFVAATGQHFIAHDLDLEPPPFEVVFSPGSIDRVRSVIAVPLRFSGEIIGALSAQSYQPNAYTDHDLELLETYADHIGIAIQNGRLFQQSQDTLAETELLYQASAEMNAVQTYDDILALLRKTTILGDVSAIQVSMNLFNRPRSGSEPPEGYDPISQWTRAPSIHNSETSYSLKTWKSALQLLKPDAATLIEEAESDPRLDEAVKYYYVNRLGAKSLVFVPMNVGGNWIGYLEGVFSDMLKVQDKEIRRLNTLASQAAVSIQNLHSLDETRQRVQELSVLFNISQALAGAAMESSEIANIVARRFLDIMNISQCSVSLKDPQEEGRLRFAIDLSRAKGQGANGEFYPTGRVGDAYPIVRYPAIRRVLESLAPAVLQASDPSLDPSTQAYLAQYGIFTLALIPLVVKGEAIGVIELIAWDQVRNFSPEQLNLALTLANAGAVALDNARLYEDQLQTSEKLREVDKLKSQFLANMSHELRTPLNSIIGFSRVIIKGIDGPTTDLQQQDLSAIYSAGQHLLNLINDILDISKIEAGKMELSFDNNVNLAELITSVMSTAAGLVKDKPVKLVKNIDPHLPFVRADTTRLRQVTLNLLSNAAKFTDAGTITVEAGVRKKPDGNQEVIIKVVDTGPGIAPEDQKRLFQPFTQVDETATRKAGGTGLGLSISRLLIEMHGGQIGLESETGKGSCFYYTLPLNRPETEIPSSSGNKVVLAVDDERSILNLYDRYLSEHGYQVVPLTDPNQVVERAKQLQPYAITLDVMMPGRNGWQVLEDLKGDALTSHIPVIICSILEDQEKGFSLGATDYLTKPILEEDLVEALTRLNSDGSIREVLVIDDDEDDLRLVQKILQKDDRYHVGLAHGGAEGLVALRTFKPQAVILDLFMPGVDGFTLLEMMRSDPGLRDVPVIIFTAGELNELSEDQQNQLAQFSQNMLHKGAFKEPELLASIEKALNRYQ